MIAGRRFVSAVALSSALALTACGDDGNDRAELDADSIERAAELAAELRSGTTTPESTVADMVDRVAGAPTSTGTTTPLVEPTGVVVPVVALDNSFRPEVVEIDVGDEVLWENRGVNDHNVLYVDGDDWGVEVEGFTPGAVYAHVFTVPGEYRYYCSIHGNEVVGMVGTVVVNG